MGTGVGVTIAGSDLVQRPARPGASQSAAPWLPALCPRAALGTPSRGKHGPRGRRQPGTWRVPGRPATARTSTPKYSEAPEPPEEEEEESSRAPP